MLLNRHLRVHLTAKFRVRVANRLFPRTSFKFAIEAFTLTFSAELAPFGISVNAVDPGPTDSGWMSNETRKQLAARFPIGRLNEPEDAASVFRFLVSSEADTITGQIIRARGGFL
jgi:3-oxoacyl-[acyl-carrier protein] reductase